MKQVSVAVALSLLAAVGAQASPWDIVTRVAVEVSGAPSAKGTAGYQLAVSYTGHKSITPDAIVVFAEPSHTLLLAHVSAQGTARDLIIQKMTSAGALAVTSGSDLNFRHVLTLPYNPGWTDERISVVLRSGEGDLLLSNAAMDIDSFHIVSTLTFTNTPTGPVALVTITAAPGIAVGNSASVAPEQPFSVT